MEGIRFVPGAGMSRARTHNAMPTTELTLVCLDRRMIDTAVCLSVVIFVVISPGALRYFSLDFSDFQVCAHLRGRGQALLKQNQQDDYILLLQFVVRLGLYNFSNKSWMNEQYSFFRKDERSPTLNHSNWTDDRVMQIMKKYEKPHRANQNHTHKKDHYDKSASPYTPSPYLKTEPQERSPVLGERNLNLDRNYSRQNDQKWSRPANQKDYCPGQSMNFGYENKTPEGYRYREDAAKQNSFSAYEQQRTPEYQRSQPQKAAKPDTTQFKFFNNRNYQEQTEDYSRGESHKYAGVASKEKEHSHFNGYQRQAYVEDSSSRRSTYLHGRSNDEYTPTRKYGNRIATEFIDRSSKEKEYSCSKSISRPKFQNIDCDTRISNIDKINDKIKRILDRCPDVKNKQDQYQYDRANKYKLDLTPTKFDAVRQDAFKNKSALRRFEDETPSKKIEPSMLKREENQRSRSCLSKQVQEDDKYSKIQEKLNQYNNRVSCLAEEKKKLNLDFKLNKPESSFCRDQPKGSHISNKSKSIEDPSCSKTSSGLLASQSHLKSKSRGKLPEVDIVLSHRSDHHDPDNDETHGEYPSVQDYRPGCPPQKYIEESSSVVEVTTNPVRIDVHQSSFESVSNVETKKLIQSLSEQAILDEQFRLSKNWFVNCEISAEYEVLQSVLEQRWREMPLQEIKAEFSVNFQEDDPFYSYRPDQFVLEDLVNNYIICNKNWKQKIEQQWDMELLESEGLMQRLDMEGKGHVALQDLVRIVNMEEGTFYRNRDLYLVFQRMLRQAGSSKLTMEVLGWVLGKR